MPLAKLDHGNLHRYLRPTAFALGLILLSGCAGYGSIPPEKDIYPARVFYGTDRAPLVGDDGSIDYGAERGEIVYGTVDLDLWQRDQAEFEAGNGSRNSNSLLGPNGSRLVSTRPLSRQEFIELLQDSTEPGQPGNVMLFVHGFKRDFRTTAENAAQIAEGISFPGRTVFWSWPSQNKAGGYLIDRTSLEWSEEHLAQFIIDLVEVAGTTRLTLVAHSLGANGLTQALFTKIGVDRLNQWNVIDNLVLLAPDIDAAIFERDLVPAIEATQIPTTIYASATDWALITSSNVNGYPRAGDASEGVLTFNGVDTIDATQVATSGIGHSYYRRSLAVLDDLRQLIVGQTPIDQRPGLIRQENGKGLHWILQ